MSGQLESNHFFRSGDRVRSREGALGTIVDSWSLYARVRWEDGREDELEQFDDRYLVIDRCPGDS